uniref:Protein kinase domain-containing protein n=1 Tax=Brassica oleracea var. oleracea TaxID=109376 RepID=A0A0D3C971_BRAOL
MEKYEVVKDIGAGYIELGGLMRVKNSKELVAMKFIERGSKIDEDLVREIMKHKSLDHPSVIRLKEVVLTPTHLAIVMEYAARGELYKHIRRAGRFSEDDARYLFQPLISAVSYCHAMKMCHRELKLEDTFLDGSPEPCLKICDFGYSKSVMHSGGPSTKTRTAAYVPPEVFTCGEYDGKMADIWSCGVTLYVMRVGARPFEDENDHRNFGKTMQVEHKGCPVQDPRRRSYFTGRHTSPLSLIFIATPVERISIADIKKHPWFLKNLPRELTETAQAAYFSKESQSFSVQTVEEIMKIVDDAKTPPPVSLHIGGFGWGEKEGDAE